jgi:hypothetical protein
VSTTAGKPLQGYRCLSVFALGFPFDFFFRSGGVSIAADIASSNFTGASEIVLSFSFPTRNS